jgi:hypothetical protein
VAIFAAPEKELKGGDHPKGNERPCPKQRPDRKGGCRFQTFSFFGLQHPQLIGFLLFAKLLLVSPFARSLTVGFSPPGNKAANPAV